MVFRGNPPGGFQLHDGFLGLLDLQQEPAIIQVRLGRVGPQVDSLFGMRQTAPSVAVLECDKRQTEPGRVSSVPKTYSMSSEWKAKEPG